MIIVLFFGCVTMAIQAGDQPSHMVNSTFHCESRTRANYNMQFVNVKLSQSIRKVSKKIPDKSIEFTTPYKWIIHVMLIAQCFDQFTNSGPT